MDGVVHGYSRDRSRVAVVTALGYCVFDIKVGEVDIGDDISGCLDDHGSQELTNLSTGQRLDVFVEAIQATYAAAQSLLRGR